MATTNKDFRVKNGLIVDGATATVNGNTVLTNAASINALSDVTISSPSSGQVLKWNGSAWINDTDATSAGGGGNSFETISANGTSVVADSSTDTLIITPGTGISILGNATSDTITFSVNGGLVPSGGTEGQVLLKTDGTDYNSYWADNSAESTFYLVRNNTGSTIVKGTLVSAYGAEPSGRIDVTPHETTGLQDSELRVMGVATANISNGVNGTVISFGTLKGIDTRGNVASAIAVGDETWTEGDILYAHPTVAGKLTNVRPQHDLAVAFITVRHASSGQIAVRIIPGNHHLEWLHDVSIANTAADKDILQLNSSGIWVNANLATAGIANLAGATFTGNVAGTNANLSGNVNATTFNGSGSGLTSIPNSATTANSANGASTIVARDADGSFTANVITATTLIGNVGISSGTVNLGRDAYGLAPIVVIDGNMSTTTFAGTITAFPASGTTSTAASGVGYMGMPRSGAALSGSYTLTASDAGEHIYTTTTRTVTIPGNTTGTGPVAFPIGTTIVFINDTGVTLTLQMQATTTDTCILSGIGTSMTGGSGTRSLAAHGMATLVKVTTTKWYISGNGLS